MGQIQINNKMHPNLRWVLCAKLSHCQKVTLGATLTRQILRYYGREYLIIRKIRIHIISKWRDRGISQIRERPVHTVLSYLLATGCLQVSSSCHCTIQPVCNITLHYHSSLSFINTVEKGHPLLVIWIFVTPETHLILSYCSQQSNGFTHFRKKF